MKYWGSLLCILFLSVFAEANPNNWLFKNTNHHAEVNFSSQKQNDRELQLLIQVHLNKGWKTYWRSPGEAGVAPEIQWNQSGFQVDWGWPLPERFDIAGITTQGYIDDVNFPLTLTGSIPEHLSGTLILPVCSNVCVITEYPFSLSTNVNSGGYFDEIFKQAVSSVPTNHGFLTSVEISTQASILYIQAKQDEIWNNPNIFIDAVENVEFGHPTIKIADHTLYAEVPIKNKLSDQPANLIGEKISLVVADGKNKTQQINTTVLKADHLYKTDGSSLFYILAMALLGGLILNCMPCVLPVLGIKINSILSIEQRETKPIRMQFLFSWLGIIFSFLALAGFMTVLRLSGKVLGWGIQFQSPIFIGFMVIFTALFAANFLGLFQIRLNSKLSNFLGTFNVKGYLGHFLEGAFATLLATPCSAPFLGTAVAFALVAPLPLLWGIFLTMALGMGLPWLLIALFPKVALYLPKPGAWMNTLKLFMGFIMLLSSLWLLSLMSAHIGFKLTLALTVILSLIFILFITKQYGIKKGLITTIAAIAIVGSTSAYTLLQAPLEDKIEWVNLSQSEINKALSENKVVFVDITADWCVTCKINKMNVILDKEIQKALTAENIVAFRGDWTKDSDEVTQYLKQNGSVAIPFNQVLGPNLPEGKILPAFLSNEDVIEALKEAK